MRRGRSSLAFRWPTAGNWRHRQESNPHRLRSKRSAYPFGHSGIDGGLLRSRTENQEGLKPSASANCASSPRYVWTCAVIGIGATGLESNRRPLAYKASALPTELQWPWSFVFEWHS